MVSVYVESWNTMSPVLILFCFKWCVYVESWNTMSSVLILLFLEAFGHVTSRTLTECEHDFCHVRSRRYLSFFISPSTYAGVSLILYVPSLHLANKLAFWVCSFGTSLYCPVNVQWDECVFLVTRNWCIWSLNGLLTFLACMCIIEIWPQEIALI